MAARRARATLSYLAPALPSNDDWAPLPLPPASPRPTPAPAARRRSAPARRPRRIPGSREFLAGLVGGAAFVLAPTLLFVARLGV